jgi:hypothetical protein
MYGSTMGIEFPEDAMLIVIRLKIIWCLLSKSAL